jgi:pantothenate kinase type III
VNLLIDLGNSRLKWAQQAPGLWRTEAALLEHAMPSLLDRLWRDMDAPRKIAPLKVQYVPDQKALEICRALGKKIADELPR